MFDTRGGAFQGGEAEIVPPPRKAKCMLLSRLTRPTSARAGLFDAGGDALFPADMERIRTAFLAVAAQPAGAC